MFFAMQARDLRRRADQVLDALAGLAERNPRLASWRAERFYEEAKRRVPVIGVDAANETRYLVYPKDNVIGKAIIREGAYDPEKVLAPLQILTGEGVHITQLLDIGANIGTTTVEILRQLPDATGVAFEPEPANFQLLKMNLIANGLDDRVEAHRFALGNEAGTLTFELSDTNLGDHRVRISGATGDFGEENWATVKVPALRLDDVPGLHVDQRTLMFLDVQGFEGHVLAGGAEALLARPALVFELWPYALDRADGTQLLLDALSGYGRFFDINDLGHGPYSHGDLGGLASRAQQRDMFGTDVLALP